MSDPVQALLDVMAERDRQCEQERFDAAHDDAHRRGELIKAAVSYATNAVVIAELIAGGMDPAKINQLSQSAGVPQTWPWSREWWKPKGARRNLVIAAALLIAEIERLDRAAVVPPGQNVTDPERYPG